MTHQRKRGRPPHQDILTPTEWKVVNLAQHGLTNLQIAKQLSVSINAIKYHIGNATEKLRAETNGLVSNKKSLLKYLGAPKDSPYHRSKRMNNHNNLTNIGQISRTVKDTAQSVKWYQDVLGLKHLYTYGQLAFFDVEGVRLCLSENVNKADDPSNESIIYFKTNDIKSSHDQLIKKGIAFTHAPHKVHTHEDGTEEWMAFFTDLEGRPLALMSQYK